MKLDDLAFLMGLTKDELIAQLKQNDVIELRLMERKDGMVKDNFKIEVLN